MLLSFLKYINASALFYVISKFAPFIFSFSNNLSTVALPNSMIDFQGPVPKTLQIKYLLMLKIRRKTNYNHNLFIYNLLQSTLYLVLKRR